ncbi:MAG: SDR family oxidoreductase [Pseudomonadaceae bacterium]|nr:SDR family oxidoreductase [Pseudomonadaceae bacterium]
MNLTGRRAIVLGGTSGIGLAAVLQLQEAGAQVVACGRSEENLAKTNSLTGDAVTCERVDVLDREGLSALFARFAPVDVLVCAATGGDRATGPFAQMDLDGFQGSFRKLWGYTNAVRLALEHLAEDASIVLVSGSPARKCQPGMSAISTVGNAVEGFARAIAPEIAPRRINVVSPGVIDTPMFPVQGEAREQFLGAATSKQLIPRPGKAEEVAAGILFVISNDFVTGSTVDVDGGALLP